MFMLQFSNINIVSSRQQVPDHAFILGVFQSGSDRYIYSDKGFDTTKMEQTGRQWRSCPVHTQVSVHGKRSLSIQTHTHAAHPSHLVWMDWYQVNSQASWQIEGVGRKVHRETNRGGKNGESQSKEKSERQWRKRRRHDTATRRRRRNFHTSKPRLKRQRGNGRWTEGVEWTVEGHVWMSSGHQSCTEREKDERRGGEGEPPREAPRWGLGA